MEQTTKKKLLIVLIVTCAALSAAITWAAVLGNKSGIPPHFAGEMMWVLCRNPACKTEYQISKKQYYTYIEKNTTPTMEEAPGLICEKCGEDSAYHAIKCDRCSLVFEYGAVPADFYDRCPKCGYSTVELEQTGTSLSNTDAK